MFSTTADKTAKPSVSVQRKTEQTFFGSQKEQRTTASEPTFFKPAIQAKLRVNQPNDVYEKEADLVAERVVNMSDQQVGLQNTAPPEVQRQEEEKEEEETIQTAAISVQRMADEEQEESPSIQTKQYTFIQREENTDMQASSSDEEESLQRYSNERSPSMYHSDVIQRSGRGPPATGVRFQNQLHNSTSGGRSMSKSVSSFMESRFGADFSAVKIHTDTSAQQMSKQVNAHAFTYGNHVYFNSGKYDPDSSSGKTLLAHELTHTIQQGASPVAQSKVQRKHAFTAVQKKSILQRQVAPQLTKAVELAEGEKGKVIANKEGADGYRYGWERLMEYFETTFGKDKIVSQPTGEKNIVPRINIKKQSKFKGNIIDHNDKLGVGMRDAMPSWCGIFAFWALNKAGIPMPKWQLGVPFIPPEAAYPPGYTPKPGDLAYKKLRSHYGLVVGMEGTNRVKSVNGNTAGDDNLGGEIQVQTHDISNWQGFFNPMVAKTGNLRDPEHGDKDTKPKTLEELLKLKYGVNRKAENENEEEEIQAKPEEDQKEEEIQTKKDGVKKEEEEEIQTKPEDDQEKEKDEEMLQAKSEEPEKEEGEETIQRTEIGSPGGFASNGVEYESDDSAADIQTKAESSLASQVKTKSNGPMIQGGWLGDAWNAVSGLASDMADLIEEGIDKAKDFLIDKVLDFVGEIPGYTLLTYIMGKDPIKGTKVNKTPLTLLDAVLDIIPIGGDTVKWVLDYFKATNPVANWLFDSVKRFSGLIESVKSKFASFWNRLSIKDVGNPERVMNDVANLFQSVVTQVVSFVDDVGKDFLSTVKDIAVTNLVTVVKKYFPNAYDLLTVILEEDPITKKRVDRNGTNILNAGLKVLGDRGAQIKRQMIENGIFEKCAGWIDRSINLMLSLVSDVKNIFSTAWELISFKSLFTPIETFNKIAEAFTTPIKRISSFITDAMIELLALLREVLVSKLSDFAKKQRGYFLVTVLIGKDPFTGNKVRRNTENIIHGFFSLMDGGEAQFQQMKESGKIDQMTQKVNKAVKRLGFTVEYVLGLFTSLWESMSWKDFLNPPGVFVKIFNTFKSPVIRLVKFIITIVKIAIEIMLIAMNFPFDTVNNIIQRSLEAFGNIKRDPIGFLKNILKGIKQGFVQFFDNILKHLMSGLATWLFGSLGGLGIKMPPDFSFKSILNLVLEILGISVDKIMERVWIKLTEQIGAEKVAKIKGAIDKLTGIWAFVKDVIKRGPIAIWEYVQEKLSELWNMVLDAAKNWIMTKVIESVITKLLSMLDPTGIMAVINSVIAIYKAIQSFIEHLKAMLEILNSFVNGVAEIAAGNIKVAADFLEGAMAKGVPVLIGFLANQVGLGDIGKKLAEIIGKVREKITEGIDWLVGKALKIGMPIINGVLKAIEFGEGLVEKGKEKLKDIASKIIGWFKFKENFKSKDGGSHKLFIKEVGGKKIFYVASEETPVEKFLKDKSGKETDTTKKAAITGALNYYQGTVVTKEKDVSTKEAEYIAEPDKKKTRAKRFQYQKATQELRSIMQTFANKLSDLDFGNENDATVRTKIKKTKKGARAGNVTAWPLTHLPGDFIGSSPKQNPPGWTAHAQDASDKWVRGHLLSEHLHGPGLNWNLTPISQSVNSGMEGVESAMIPRIKEQDKFFFYITNVTYDDSRTDENVNIPTDISIESGELEREEGKDDSFIKKDTNTVPFTVGIPTMSGPPNLNSIGRPTMEIKGINSRLARDILSCRDKFQETHGGFDDLPDLINKLQMFYAGTLTPKDGNYPKKWLSELSNDHITSLNTIINTNNVITIS
ncbi:hypothetical protein IWQ47_004368 [Aquimarina sp. EL_43]|uniref:eCIS core domain-containing protein n=1 Tax=unclassified Aquimarina TaxID=2627091 RepID=UPI0018C8E949|nr:MULTISPECIES: DUF4157 domain-containing protein [unclassified Aquimarina]MBG6132802.1 hypothetical protein [Aquimarina sp. EL_35]MBG6153121.1 hypothetical protein [Aquimarina sp. EL_32]MBG6171277.1 hypothetical protein [Aquimarina sp. EL_43]